MVNLKKCSNCGSTDLHSEDISIELKAGLTEMILNTSKNKKFEIITCWDCGFVMFFDIERTRV